LLWGEGIDHQFADQVGVTGCRAADHLHAEGSDSGDHSAVVSGAGSATDQATALKPQPPIVAAPQFSKN